ncbi:MAG: CDP-glycerol glycerophosphotransferase family protein [Endomicrobia bacterium]|nr:CDP-glycerol glycerophosphotransferase family protein [Endomicrobiia bacterium]
MAAGYFLIRTILLKIRVFLFREKKTDQTQNKYVIYAEDKRYWVFFKIVLEEFESRKIDVLYLTSSVDDPVFASDFKYVKGKYIGKGNKAIAYLNFLSADVVLATTPDLDVLQWKRSKNVRHYCHIQHAPAGSSMTYRMFALDYYDSVLLSSDMEINEIRYLESIRNLPEKQLVVVGNTFFDLNSEKIKNLPVEEERLFTVLVSPSWGDSALLKLYGEKLLEPLAKTGWRIIVRPHPQSAIVEKAIIERLTEQYKKNPNVEWDYHHDNIHSLSKADVMISDFSGIIYDYVFLFDKPVIISLRGLDLRPYDAHFLKEEPFYIQTLRNIGLELDAANLDSIKETIQNLSQNEELKNNRREAKKMMWQYRGESGKRIVDFLTKVGNI